jgi:hypothetical protein
LLDRFFVLWVHLSSACASGNKCQGRLVRSIPAPGGFKTTIDCVVVNPAMAGRAKLFLEGYEERASTEAIAQALKNAR